MDLKHSRTTILNQGAAEEKREEIRQYFHNTYSLDEQLYETLATEKTFYSRPEPLRHPLIFYIGHTAAFYINKLIVAGIVERRLTGGRVELNPKRTLCRGLILCGGCSEKRRVRKTQLRILDKRSES